MTEKITELPTESIEIENILKIESNAAVLNNRIEEKNLCENPQNE